jgi:hypothetical protein
MEGRFLRGDGIAFALLAVSPKPRGHAMWRTLILLVLFLIAACQNRRPEFMSRVSEDCTAGDPWPAICLNLLRKPKQPEMRYLASDSPSGCSPEFQTRPNIPAARLFPRRQHLVERGKMSALRRPTIWGHRVENREVRRNDSPSWAVAGKDRDRWLEGCRVVQGAGVDRENLGFANFATEYEAATNGTRITHGVSAACGFGYESSSLTAEAHCVARKPHEWYETRPGCFTAIRTVAVPRVYWLTFSFVT